MHSWKCKVPIASHPKVHVYLVFISYMPCHINALCASTLGTIHIWRPENCPIFKTTHLPPLAQLRPKFFHPLDLERPVSSKPLVPSSTNDKKHNPGITIVMLPGPFLQVGFCFQFQLINLVWLSIDFFPFSWSQPSP